MEKESLISSLKERIGENDFNAISRRSVETIIEPLLPMFADDEKVTEETYALPVALLKSFIGQSRHDIAAGIKSEKERYEAEKEKAVKDAVEAYKNSLEKDKDKGGEKEKKGEGAKQTDDIDSIIEDKFKSLLESLTGEEGAIGKLNNSLNTFINEYNERRKAEKVSDIQARIRENLQGLGETNVKLINLAIKEVDFDGDKDFDTLLKEVKAEYESLFKEFYGDGVRPFAGGAGGESSSTSFKSYIERQQKLAEQQAKDAEALQKKMI